MKRAISTKIKSQVKLREALVHALEMKTRQSGETAEGVLYEKLTYSDAIAQLMVKAAHEGTITFPRFQDQRGRDIPENHARLDGRVWVALVREIFDRSEGKAIPSTNDPDKEEETPLGELTDEQLQAMHEIMKKARRDHD